MKRNKFLACFISILLLCNFIFSFNCITYAETTDTPTVNAPVALLIDMGTGKVLYDKNSHERRYPASTTKIMTAILTLENCNLTDIAKVSYDAIFSVPSGYTNANLQLDEELSVEDLLYALLIPSANDAANVLAEHIGGSIESFASMMNSKALELGCTDTNFVNPNGVHDENHYSTAYDLALMGRYAMQNDIFRKIVTTVRYTLPSTNKYEKEDRIFLTTNKLINSKSGQYYEYSTGIKTGYTVAAGNCIVASAKKNDMELLCVIMRAGNDNLNTNKFQDCINLFDYGFDHYTYKQLCEKGNTFKVITPRNATKDTKNLDVLYEDDIYALVNMEDSSNEFYPEIDLDEKLKAPITKGSVIGKITYSINDIQYTTNLIAGQDVLANSIFLLLFKIAIAILVIIILKKILNNISNNKKRKRKSKKSKKSKKTSYRKTNYDPLYHFDN